MDTVMSRSPLEPFFQQSQGRYQSFKNVFISPGGRATFGGGPTENDEIRMAKLEGMTNGQMTKDRAAGFLGIQALPGPPQVAGATEDGCCF